MPAHVAGGEARMFMRVVHQPIRQVRPVQSRLAFVGGQDAPSRLRCAAVGDVDERRQRSAGGLGHLECLGDARRGQTHPARVRGANGLEIGKFRRRSRAGLLLTAPTPADHASVPTHPLEGPPPRRRSAQAPRRPGRGCPETPPRVDTARDGPVVSPLVLASELATTASQTVSPLSFAMEGGNAGAYQCRYVSEVGRAG